MTDIRPAVPLLTYFTFMVSIVLHELAHGYSAFKYGDNKARDEGRLTLNPFKHLDLVGSVAVPIIMLAAGMNMFGWAKPVPVDFKRLTKFQRLVVSSAGIIVNLILAILGLIGFHMTNSFMDKSAPIAVQGMCVLVFMFFIVNCLLIVFNCMPFPPFDGWTIVTTMLKEKTVDAVEKHKWVGYLGLIMGIFSMALLLRYIMIFVRIMTLMTLNQP